jgi:hypothetical protein
LDLPKSVAGATMKAFEPIHAWGVIEPCGKLVLRSIADTPDRAKEFFLGSEEIDGWGALEMVGVTVVGITIQSSVNFREIHSSIREESEPYARPGES